MSHLSDLGFTMEKAEDLGELMGAAFAKGVSHYGKNCEYKLLEIPPGIEIWVSQKKGLFGGKSKQGFHPHFNGKTKNKVKVAEIVVQNNDYPTEGGYTVWANQSEEKVKAGAQEHPYVFESCRFLLDNIKIGEMIDVQITAFAEQVKIYEDEVVYRNDKENVMAVQSFIPAGMFRPGEGGGPISPPQAIAIFSGFIKESIELTNSATGNKFFSLLVSSLDAEYDVVIDPILVNKTPEVGNVINGVFWMSGKVLN